ncbi:endonuclease SmrB [Actinobacillus succinogenes]|uniref:Ribosome rescue factor SmrB n=1 Tax=Actinobacillus succinogenes (strain ATCC 55618 / DSM 22257 / CCUG 43843 / 130Z) TaxID=339671 RepID=A6VP04_ACTSZ|nr:endonuclease SmrB [Actinobacillus succinogenes]ABR74701.1 Smr protein/MutS2 [Actinobacillus succinogenes 130Z]PHI40878.1 endonuclease SmrB [Actinobacillus succinogenes]
MLKEEDIALFRENIQGTKKIKQDTFVAPRKINTNKKSETREIREKQDTLFYFSDEYEPLLDEESAVKYLRENEDSYLLKQLRRGDFSPELFLDLHGLTREQAKQELAALLQACADEHVYCASIMTGYGTFTLKKQIPRWLVQHPRVRALHQAPKEWGGDAAILILVDV